MTKFTTFVNSRFGLDLTGYFDLYNFSITRPEDFWAAIWDFVGIEHQDTKL